jgi:hypothetical protein
MCQGRVAWVNPLFSICRALWRPSAPASRKKSCRKAEESRTRRWCTVHSLNINNWIIVEANHRHLCRVKNMIAEQWQPPKHRHLCRVKNMLAGQGQPPKKSVIYRSTCDFLGGCHCPASIFLTLHKQLWANEGGQILVISQNSIRSSKSDGKDKEFDYIYFIIWKYLNLVKNELSPV